ncbi:hypothetical protein [Microbispora hainanensis]|uniref:Uncharacterized protein n=1 Tax=Microbispora hainanensis TaxID=568844 RepID=A0ABZ1SRX6_9ACTN|nr:hypothetical protein [Microbispora hainanensis]
MSNYISYSETDSRLRRRRSGTEDVGTRSAGRPKRTPRKAEAREPKKVLRGYPAPLDG